MFTATTFVLLLLALWSGLAFAQIGSQNASIPNCIRACDAQAIRASNCASEDQYCHCVRYTTILDNIVPCVQHNSTCANETADLLSAFKDSFDIAHTDQHSVRELVRRCLSEVQLVRPYECDWQHNASKFIAYPDALHQSSLCGECVASWIHDVASVARTHCTIFLYRTLDSKGDNINVYIMLLIDV